ncbi:thiol-disulfide oxidoreductase DCC family protein [Mangrovibacterium sp.]|uniref:thiol-disulfide oxidoreductase DCC family protein n=1 Tax=Mangrovibacterium sp. TaxID=1961364 RepID=UPI0035658166
MELPRNKSLILFDGYCHLCSGTVRRIISLDKNFRYLFAPINGEVGQKWRHKLKIPESVDSIILITNDAYYTHDEAVLKVATEIGGLLNVLRIGYILPSSWRFRIYGLVARNRFSWFGHRRTCFLPNEKQRARFLL